MRAAHGLLLLAVCAAGAGIGGCSAAPHPASPSAPLTLADEIRARGLDPAEVIVPFEIGPELVAWGQQRVPPRADPNLRLDALLKALLVSPDMDLVYQSDANGTAQEVFASGRANCLAFAFLFAGLARSAGLPVGFLLVPEVERFSREGDYIIVSEHATVVFGDGPTPRVLEFGLGPTLDYRRAVRISDLTAIGLYYSNLGAQALRSGDLEAARELLEKSAKLAPNLTQAWTNLGVARRRLGDAEGAEAAYFQALDLDPKNPSVYQNLAVLAQTRAGQQEALNLLARVDQLASQNPYSYLCLGDLALALGNDKEAGRFYREAQRRAPKDAEMLAALGTWHLRQGQQRAARKLLQRARKIDAQGPRVLALASRLSKAQGS